MGKGNRRCGERMGEWVGDMGWEREGESELKDEWGDLGVRGKLDLR